MLVSAVIDKKIVMDQLAKLKSCNDICRQKLTYLSASDLTLQSRETSMYFHSAWLQNHAEMDPLTQELGDYLEIGLSLVREVIEKRTNVLSGQKLEHLDYMVRSLEWRVELARILNSNADVMTRKELAEKINSRFVEELD